MSNNDQFLDIVFEETYTAPDKAIIKWTTDQLMVGLYHCQIMMPVNEVRMWAMIALPIIKTAHERGTFDEPVAG